MDAEGKLWLVTAVLKQDLWAHSEKEVLHFYKKGDHANVVRDIAKSRGSHFNPECLPVSLLIENLRTTRGVLLAETASGFDAPEG